MDTVVIVIMRARMAMPVRIVNADAPMPPISVLFQVKLEDSGVFQSFFLIRRGVGYEDLLFERDITLLGDHEHDHPTGDAFSEFGKLVHIYRKDRAWCFTQIDVRIIEVDVRSLGRGLDLEGSVHADIRDQRSADQHQQES